MDKITIKTADEIELMRESGRLLAKVFTMLDDFIVPGVSTLADALHNAQKNLSETAYNVARLYTTCHTSSYSIVDCITSTSHILMYVASVSFTCRLAVF